ncbi:protein HYPER-SENSITIVITY-RELATED 4-like [Lycium ferocissimum]|uniref:protein HYPER-SENSITIVITY-RELATED 4-like n=1 Tax=Lycium ferocissimum TaxID=112874 RepID=UPI0028164E57|nr:protein HYPER-SENSITIVITY-RELATED 4-like [Lycium ferocissimum]
MDMQIHMSYCTPSGFRILVYNYLGLKNHHKFGEVDELIIEVNVTPAEIAEELMKSDEADIALEGLIKFLHKKKLDCEETNVGKDEVNEKGNEMEKVKEEVEMRVMRKCGGKTRKRGKSRSQKFSDIVLDM